MADRNSQQYRNLTAEAIVNRAQGAAGGLGKDAVSTTAGTLSQTLSPEAYKKLTENLLTARLGQLRKD